MENADDPIIKPSDMGNDIVTIALMVSYAFVLLVVWAIFEKRVKVMYRRHLEKCAPFAKNGLRKVDTRLKIIIRITMAILMILSLSIIYFMTV